jgi:hypothetical protein
MSLTLQNITKEGWEKENQPLEEEEEMFNIP